MIVFKKKSVIFFVCQMIFKKTVQHAEYFLEFIFAQFFDYGSHQLVIGKLLQVIDNRIFISFPVKTESYETIVSLDVIVRVLGHFFSRKKLTLFVVHLFFCPNAAKLW
jgi:hypothetical protein